MAPCFSQAIILEPPRRVVLSGLWCCSILGTRSINRLYLSDKRASRWPVRLQDELSLAVGTALGVTTILPPAWAWPYASNGILTPLTSVAFSRSTLCQPILGVLDSPEVVTSESAARCKPSARFHDSISGHERIPQMPGKDLVVHAVVSESSSRLLSLPHRRHCTAVCNQLGRQPTRPSSITTVQLLLRT